MKCRFCGQKIRKKDPTCPACGRKDPQMQVRADYAQMKRTAIAFGCIAALSALAIVLFVAMQAGWDLGNSFRWLKLRENDIYYKNSYTVSDRKANRKRNQVVAAMGDRELTNAQLQIYYWMQVRDFALNYGDTTAYLDVDYTDDLATQIYTDGVTTWQQYFLESALQMWQSNQAFAALAEENGYTLPSAYQSNLDNLQAELESTAVKNGYADAEAMLRAEMGAGTSVADYTAYLQVYYTGYLYFQQLYSQIHPTEAEIQAYYQENLSDFVQAGITESAGNYVDVRHILIAVDGDTDEDWSTCRKEAEAVLTQWESSGKTEADFIMLAAAYSEDDGTAYSGGLFSDLAQGDLEMALDTWCFAPERSTGDYELLRTDYGYHIVYFIDSEPIWHAEARTALIQSLGRDLVDEVMAKYETKVDYRKIVLARVKISE